MIIPISSASNQLYDKRDKVNFLSFFNEDVACSKDIIRYKHKAYINNIGLFKYICQNLISDVFLR